MTTTERLEEQSFCYDPDFPPDVAEGMPLARAVAAKQHAEPRAVRRALKPCAALVRRGRSGGAGPWGPGGRWSAGDARGERRAIPAGPRPHRCRSEGTPTNGPARER